MNEGIGRQAKAPAPQSYILLALAAVAFAAGMAHLFGREYATGETYPEYSSLRAGPEGGKLLFDSLARVPGVSVERNYLPIEFSSVRDATVFLLGVAPESLDDVDETLKPIEKLAGRGNRIVLGLRYEAGPGTLKAEDLEKQWGVRYATDTDRTHARHLYFAEAKGWTAMESGAEKPRAIERAFGAGSVALFADSAVFSNEDIAATGRLALVAAALGGHTRVIFDEQHFGIAQSGSVVGLVRRFRLTGLAVGLAIWAALWIWKNAAGFPPPVARPAGPLLGRTSQAGLVTLLRSHIQPEALAGICWRTWLETNRSGTPPERIGQAEAVLRDAGSQPLEAVRRIGALLRGKGKP
jgi:hypothetical protein